MGFSLAEFTCNSWAGFGRPRARKNGRKEYLEETRPSTVYNGGTCVPLLKTGKVYPAVLTSHQFHLRHCALLEARLDDLYAGPVYCPVAGRMLSEGEAEARKRAVLRALLGPDMFGETRHYTRAEPAGRFHLKAVGLLLGLLVDHFSKPVYCAEAGRHLTDRERAECGEWHMKAILPETYDDDGPFRWVRFVALERPGVATEWLQ